MNNKVMLNIYPDSIGENLNGLNTMLDKIEFKDVFNNIYILPSVFNSDLDRGFSVIDYNLNQEYATTQDLEDLKNKNLNLKLDFILNHASVLSPQFQDLIKNGKESKYFDFFINWNEFWKDNGVMNKAGYIEPNPELIKSMFFRKSGLPILMVKMSDNTKVPYWNTFYQKINYRNIDTQDIMKMFNIQYQKANALNNKLSTIIENNNEIYLDELTKEENLKLIEFLESDIKYLGQMDLNIKSEKVWNFYDETLRTLASYGAKVVRLDAFAYTSKEVGEKNFLNEPYTWDILNRVGKLAEKYDLKLLPEIHATYGEKIHERICANGYMTYDFFLPGLILDAIENKNTKLLNKWAHEIIEKDLKVINMLGCHDGIPLLDLKGLMSEDEISKLMNLVISRGGYVKNLHGQKNMYYQVNATYFSALNEDENKLLLARAIQMFMPGIPQVWYLDLFAKSNDYEAVKKAGKDGHKEINRTNLKLSEIETLLSKDVVKKQLDLIKLRNTHPAFNGELTLKSTDNTMEFAWINEDAKIILEINLEDLSYNIEQ